VCVHLSYLLPLFSVLTTHPTHHYSNTNNLKGRRRSHSFLQRPTQPQVPCDRHQQKRQWGTGDGVCVRSGSETDKTTRGLGVVYNDDDDGERSTQLLKKRKDIYHTKFEHLTPHRHRIFLFPQKNFSLLPSIFLSTMVTFYLFCCFKGALFSVLC
jgi:hypothetical protein